MLTLSKTTLNCTLDHTVNKLSSIDVNRFIPFFNNLPIDPYLKEPYRFRRFSRFRIIHDQVKPLAHTPFAQSKVYNFLLGDVIREYLELDPELMQLQDFQQLVLEFFHYCQQCSTSEQVGVHQIRIVAAEAMGNPAPEGIHRDGVDLVGIFCVNRQHISGGVTHLYPSQNGKPVESQPVFRKILDPGELLIVNDQRFFHFTTPIQALLPQGGVRDVFVLTCPGLPG